MEFKIPVDKMQVIAGKLASVCRLNEDNVKGKVLIEVNDVVKFSATDGRVNATVTSRDSEPIEKGKILCRFADIKGYLNRFTQLTDDFGTEKFHFLIKDSNGVIKTKTVFHNAKPSYRTLKFSLSDVDEYPKYKPFDDAQLVINSSILKDGVSRVINCINPGEVRAAMTGVLIVIDESTISFVGTDGVKLAEAVLEVHADIKNTSYIFTHSFAAILKALLDYDGQVFISFQGNTAYVKCNDDYIVGALIVNEPYPDYSSILIDNSTNAITVPRLSFTDSVVSAMDVLDTEDNNRLTLFFKGNSLLLKNDRVEATQEFDEPFADTLDVDLNGEYFASLLTNFTGEYIDICFSESDSPIVIKSKGDDKHTALIMPVNKR